MSIEDIQIPFPRFLLIDTPERLGTDQENLEKSISKLSQLWGKKKRILGASPLPLAIISSDYGQRISSVFFIMDCQ